MNDTTSSLSKSGVIETTYTRLCSAHPKVAPGQIVRVFKSITAREIFRRKPSAKRALWGGEFWTDGYYVATVGEGGSWEVIERYMRNQGKPKDEL